MGRHNNREQKNDYQSEKQTERELQKLRNELIKPKTYQKKNYNGKKQTQKKFDKKQK